MIRKRSGRNASVSSEHSDHSDHAEGHSMLELTEVLSPDTTEPQSPTLKVDVSDYVYLSKSMCFPFVSTMVVLF